MKVSRESIEDVVDKLQLLLDDMKDNDIKEVRTDCNTYGLYNYICFGSNGFLDLSQDSLSNCCDNEEDY